jgi:hypothetical protein
LSTLCRGRCRREAGKFDYRRAEILAPASRGSTRLLRALLRGGGWAVIRRDHTGSPTEIKAERAHNVPSLGLAIQSPRGG